MSKGSKQRPTDKSKYDVNWERIFGVKDDKEKKKSLEETSHNNDGEKKNK